MILTGPADRSFKKKTMSKAVMALLCGAYLFLASTVAVLLWRTGAGWGAGMAGLIGTLGVAFALHNLIGRAVEGSKLRDELERLREAHRLMVDHIEATQNALDGLEQRLEAAAETRTQVLTDEVHMLEALVARLGEGVADPRVLRSYGGGGDHGRTDPRTAALLETVRDALTDNRVDLYLQPVVSLPQRRTVFYESFSRLRDAAGRVLMPAEYLRVAEPEGLISAIDNLLLFRCVQIVRRLAKTDRRIGIFCNISLASLGDEVFFPQFLDFLSQNKDLSGALIFELGQNAFARNMAKLADLGYRFSMDKVSDLDLDFSDLSRADVKFVKVAAGVLLEQLLEVDGRLTLRSLPDVQASDYAALTRRYGIELIVEKVESERQVIDILELEIGYGQGHLFGEPRAIRDSVLAETAPPADFMNGALRRAGGESAYAKRASGRG
jgi:cyclic-di-GMP phosphodiesterase TipF (flagellum assembly factor)